MIVTVAPENANGIFIQIKSRINVRTVMGCWDLKKDSMVILLQFMFNIERARIEAYVFVHLVSR